MCQDALQELKMAIKASGEHKQRIIVHIAIDGLKIRDEKTGVTRQESSMIHSANPAGMFCSIFKSQMDDMC